MKLTESVLRKIIMQEMDAMGKKNPLAAMIQDRSSIESMIEDHFNTEAFKNLKSVYTQFMNEVSQSLKQEQTYVPEWRREGTITECKIKVLDDGTYFQIKIEDPKSLNDFLIKTIPSPFDIEMLSTNFY